MGLAARMRHFVWGLVSGTLAFTLVATGSASAHPLANTAGPVTVTRIKVKDRTEIQRLVSEGYDVAGANLENGTVDVLTHGQQESLSLKFLGFDVRSMVNIDPTIAPDDGYKTPAEIETLLKQYAAQYPDIVRIESIGKSTDQRDIWALRITDNPDVRETDEPTILFNGMHHAREVMTPEIALDTIDFLLTKYGSDAQATRWVESNEIWIVPMLNPDGNNKVWTEYSMWRKNTRGGYGVDINRNYPAAWGSCNGSSGSTWSDTYRGPSAGSEPETQALMGLVARIQPVFDISYHSYSELVIYPMGCDGQRTATKEVVEKIGREMAAKIVSDNGRGTYSPGTAWELLYSVDGGDIDWMYNEHNVIPFVIEVNSDNAGFQPPYSHRQQTVDKLRPAWSYILDKVEKSGVRGLVTDGSGRAQPGAVVMVEGLGSERMQTVIWKVKNDGTYHVVLNPGMYRLTFGLGDRSQTRDVTIGEDRVQMDIEL